MVERDGRAFRSCLLVAARDTPTMHVIRALHGAGFAVLERTPDRSTLSLAGSGEFDIVAWAYHESLPATLTRLAAEGIACVTLHVEATPASVSEALNAGAEACLQLDADAAVIVAQVNAVLRRTARPGATGPDDGILQIGDLTVDVDRCEVERGGEFVPLTAQEFRIVEHMARNAGRVLRPHEILNAVSDDYEYLPREAQEVFKVAVRRIRRKLEPVESQPRYLVTVRGFGYRLEGGDHRARRAGGRTQTA